MSAYCKSADRYDVKNGRRTREAEIISEMMVRFVQPLYGRVPAIEFGPCALKAMRQKLSDAGYARGVINRIVDRIRRMFCWAASEEMVPVAVPQALATVAGLRKGRTTAREPVPVLPVPNKVVDDTLPYLPEVVASVVRFERLTGCRPSEVCQLRPCDVDHTSDVWAYRPASHKTEHEERSRVIFIGLRARAVILPYLLRAAAAYCFSPAEFVQKMREARQAARKTPFHYGNRAVAQTKPWRCRPTAWSRWCSVFHRHTS